MSNAQLIEQKAMVLDRHAVLQLVSALRRYREASRDLLQGRYMDGGIDGAAASRFESEVAAIEEETGCT